jgi:hypothetical protein
MFRTGSRSRLPLFLLWILYGVSFAIGMSVDLPQQKENQQALGRIQDEGQQPLPSPEKSSTFPALLDALDVLQADYFEIWQGIWPKSIDWTSAVVGTYLSAALTTISTSFASQESSKSAENVVNKYFSQLVASYFGQDAFSLRQEAYDDMLWVVLGWLESIKFINTHSELHYGTESDWVGSWYGEQWIPAFAHRARIFWDMASQGWDTSLCNGGMIWSPYLSPYKNAITNELYIAASVSMYLYFPGDDNSSPFGFSGPKMLTMEEPAHAHDPKYLAAAVEGYRWLIDSNMTDSKGLYVDGYHVSGWSRERPKNGSFNTECDQRNEMVYTYNQGVLLSGQRGLYEATGARSYLEDGHQLISDVIAATGWDLKHNKPVDFVRTPDNPRRELGPWHGLGRAGILEEACDAPGYCSQDAQTFKGIFFHHLTSFCLRLPDHLVLPEGFFLSKDLTNDAPGGLEEVRKWHDEKCANYAPWIKHNAKAALTTIDTKGRFGMWWGAPPHTNSDPNAEVILPDDAVDYRNQGVPHEWKDRGKYRREIMEQNGDFESHDRGIGIRDLNDRGRGRTVETQGGGVSVLRAMWEIVDTR